MTAQAVYAHIVPSGGISSYTFRKTISIIARNCNCYIEYHSKRIYPIWNRIIQRAGNRLQDSPTELAEIPASAIAVHDHIRGAEGTLLLPAGGNGSLTLMDMDTLGYWQA